MKRLRTFVQVAAVLAIAIGMPEPRVASAETERLVFVSQTPLKAGFIGGITGADSVCRETAEEKGFDGVFLAFIGDGIVGPANRFDADLAPLVNARGERVAADWRGLAAGDREAPVLQLDGAPGGAAPWTNVQEDGRSGLLATACDRWWNAGHRHAGAVGIVVRDVASCDSLRPFICLEQ